MKNLLNNNFFISIASLVIVISVLVLIASVIEVDTVGINANTIICK